MCEWWIEDKVRVFTEVRNLCDKVGYMYNFIVGVYRYMYMQVVQVRAGTVPQEVCGLNLEQ